MHWVGIGLGAVVGAFAGYCLRGWLAALRWRQVRAALLQARDQTYNVQSALGDNSVPCYVIEDRLACIASTLEALTSDQGGSRSD